jgi:hypothetical protein
LWLHILLQASCKTAMETVPFCFRNQSKSLAQPITSPHTGNSHSTLSLHSPTDYYCCSCLSKISYKTASAKATSASPKKVKIVCFQTSISLTPEAYKSFNVPIRKRIKLQPASQVLTTRIFFCKSEEACHRDLIASSYKKSITKQKVSLSYEKPGSQYYSAPLNIPWSPSQSQICVGDGHLHSIRYSTYHCYTNKFTPWDLVTVRRLGMKL